jgi:cytochrome c6
MGKGGSGMKRTSIVFLLLAGTVFPGINGCDRRPAGSGEALFQQHCAACHPNGGNTITPLKTLHAKDLNANSIKTRGDVVQRMRNPGTGMPRFDRNVITDREADRIAGYILSTFK